jgi:uncharacterized protein YeeX (DUF496 family)
MEEENTPVESMTSDVVTSSFLINVHFIKPVDGNTMNIKQTVEFNDLESLHIHPDDAIYVIKNKIIRESAITNISAKELCLFSKHVLKLTAKEIYDAVTRSDDVFLDKIQMEQLCKNLGKPLPDETKTTYSYEEFTQVFSTEETEYSVFQPIGQKFETGRNYLFSANPYDSVLTGIDIKSNPLFTFDNSLLLNYLQYDSNSVLPINYDIYVCLAEDVLEFGEEKELSSDYLIKMYFPFLYKDNIRNSSVLLEKKQDLLEKYQSELNDNTWKLYETVDLFNNVYKNRTTELPYAKKGITEFRVILHTNFQEVLPLDTIFKSIHATKQIPFIKYNPGFRKENIYRLYTEKTATNGRKIPFLSSAEITKLSRELGKSGQISLFIQENYDVPGSPNNGLNIYLHFHKDGKIYFNVVMGQEPVDKKLVYEIIFKKINPILENLNSHLYETGYQIRLIEKSHGAEYIEIDQINYTTSIFIFRKMSLEKYKNCLSSLFDIEDFHIQSDDGAKLKFKRVENYQEMDPVNVLISNEYSKTRDIENVINALIQDFRFTEEKARERTVQFFSEHTIIRGRLLDNSGFPVSMKVISSENKLEINVDQIQDIAYVDLLYQYFDSVIRMFQSPETSTSTEELLDICKQEINYKNADKPQVSNIIAPNTELIGQIVQPILFTEDDDDFFENDDDDDDDDAVEKSDEVVITGDAADEEVEGEEDELFGMDVEGGGDEDELEINVEGKSLKNPNPFQEKIEKYDPTLILKQNQGKYAPYSKTCPTAVQRQPVLLTNKEKENIDAKHPGSYSTAIQYGSTPDKENWYICPRYWSLKTNTSLSDTEVAEILKTNPNAIIPPKSKVVPKGAFIYEFNSPKEHQDETGNYITHYPGLISGKHPDGHSLPCCFKKMQSQEKQREKEAAAPKTNKYVMSMNSHPLPKDRWGFLPSALQYFLKTDYKKNVDKENPALIKKGGVCLLRYGVEQHEQQSFIGCFAEIYASTRNIPSVPSISEMRRLITDAIDIDRFIKYHNGSLISVFRPNLSTKLLEDIDVSIYQESVFYSENNTDIDTQFFKETIAAFENFQHYLNDDTSFIDHTYLWDIISQPNNNLIVNGLNLVIIEIPKPNVVEIVCPTSSYSPQMFDKNRETLLLYKDGPFYEPIYYYDNKQTKFKILRLFSPTPQTKSLLLFLENNMKNQCKPKDSLPRLYDFKRNLPVETIIDILKTPTVDYKIHTQVLNYQSKIVGLIVSSSASYIRFFLPSSPSALLDDYDFEFMDDVTDWKDYKTTVRELNQLKVASKGRLFCTAKTKIVDNGMIIGLLTETNQYIKISPSIENVADGLSSMDGIDYLEADKHIFEHSIVEIDNPRITTIRNIRMESKFYRLFRSTIRTMLSHYEYRFFKLKIIDMLENLAFSYQQKLVKLVDFLKQVVKTSIQFREMTDDDLDYLAVENHFREYSFCKKCENRNLCSLDTNGHCQLVLPSEHLITGMENEKLYYFRLADELLRFHRIRSYMLEPMYYLNLSNIDYQINDDEILLLETYIKSENFSDLRIFNFSDYLKNIPYELAEPAKKTQVYSNVVELVPET